MTRLIRSALLVLAALLACVAAPLRAQEVTAAGRGNGMGFTYGWDGGVTTGSDGKLRMTQPPVVRTVAEGSVAARAGLRAGDIIVTANGRDGRTRGLFEGIAPGAPVVLRIRRAGRDREVTLRMPARPARGG